MFLEIDHLYKSYADVDALSDISITIDQGDFLVLVGPSGCGKSTLLNSIAGLESVTKGDIRMGGQSMVHLPPSERDIAMVFQSYALYPTMTVADNIAFGMRMRGVSKVERTAAVARVAAMLKIQHLLDRKPKQLSGGQRQRVAMGRALVRDPELFLFDEPLSNLDAKLRVDVRNEIKRLHQTVGTTMVYVTHDQIEALTLATKIAVLKDGCLQQLGSPADIYQNPANMFVADFMGSPAMNLIEATVDRRNGEVQAHIYDENNQVISLPVDRKKMPALEEWLGKPIVLGIRPEQVSDHTGVDKLADHVVDVACMVDLVEPAGADTFVVVQLGGKGVTFRMRANATVEPGRSCTFYFHMDLAVFFNPDDGKRIV